MGFYCMNAMLLLWIAIGTVEICVLILIVAAAILAAAIRPADNKPVLTLFATGDIVTSADIDNIPSLSVNVRDFKNVELLRSALPANTSQAALAITVKGPDVFIEERLTMEPTRQDTLSNVVYIISCLTPNTRYHVHFNSASQSRHCAFTLLTTPGYSTTAQLHQ